MDKEIKKYAEINGGYWEAGLPFCEGCPEFCIPCQCAYEGNGCRFPDKRVQRPRTYQTAYLALQQKTKVSDEEVRKLEIEYKLGE